MPDIDIKLAASIALVIFGLVTAGGSWVVAKVRTAWRNWRGSVDVTITAPDHVGDYVQAVRVWAKDAPADVVLGYVEWGHDELEVLRAEIERRGK